MDKLLQIGTKIGQYQIDKIPYFVKREDLACPSPGPPFAKVRGLYPYLLNLKNNGTTVVGYMDTAISMAGWGVSYFAERLGMQAVLFYPQYKDGHKFNQKYYIRKWEKFNAIIIPLEHPTQHQININRAKKYFKSVYPEGVWLPNGLKFEETIQGVAQESYSAMQKIQPSSIICSVGSGVMLAGVLLGIYHAKCKIKQIIGVLAHREMNIAKKMGDVLCMGDFEQDKHRKLFTISPTITNITDNIQIVSSEYLYHEQAQTRAPFPCNPYYDLKAFEYLQKNITKLAKPILFWNIGG